MPKEILIRDMRDEDVPIVAAIEKMSFTLPWSETSFAGEVHKLRSLPRVALVNGTIVGYICSEYLGGECHILNLAVHPQFRMQGIANTLVKHILKELESKACRFLYLEVRDSNFVAKKLYQGFGFKIVGTRKNYYVAPVEDAVIMMIEM